MLELLIILAVMVFIVSKLEKRHFEQAKADWGLTTKPEGSPQADTSPAPKPRLRIEGTQRPGIANPKFVKGFGLNPASLADLRVYAHFGRLEQFPETIRKLLHDLYTAGCAVGPSIMELMFHGRGLREGEAIYFALVEGNSEPHVVAFVDRLRLN